MKVDNPRAQFGAPVTGVETDPVRVTPRTPAAPEGDAVRLSGDLRLAEEAVRAATVSDEIRADEVARARALIERGELDADLERLADRLIDVMLEARADNRS